MKMISKFLLKVLMDFACLFYEGGSTLNDHYLCEMVFDLVKTADLNPGMFFFWLCSISIWNTNMIFSDKSLVEVL